MNRNTEFLLGIQRAIRLYEEKMKEIGNRHGLTGGDMDVISFLQNNPGKDTAADIVELRRLSKGGVSKAVEDLIQKQFLLREPDRKDRRKVHLKITPEAGKITKEIEETRRELWKLMFQDFSEEEIQEYMKLTDRIFYNIKKKGAKGCEAE